MTTRDIVAGDLLPPLAGPVALRCRKGIVWVTQEGDAHDDVLRNGDAHDFEGSGRVTVQAMETASVEIAALRRRHAG